MNKLVVASAILAGALAVTPAVAQQSLAVGGGFNFGNVQTAAGTISAGQAAAGSLAAGNVTSLGAGFATATPAGTLAAGVGASAGQAGSISGAASIGNGAALTAGNSQIIGVGVGGGFANQLP